jgi:hypothetical protein
MSCEEHCSLDFQEQGTELQYINTFNLSFKVFDKIIT